MVLSPDYIAPDYIKKDVHALVPILLKIILADYLNTEHLSTCSFEAKDLI